MSPFVNIIYFLAIVYGKIAFIFIVTAISILYQLMSAITRIARRLEICYNKKI